MNNLSIFAVNRHAFAYFALVDKLQSHGRKKLRKSHPDYVYYEAHHGLPKALFPEFALFKDHPWNKVLATPREHYVLHKLLCRSLVHTRDRVKMNKALYCMNLPLSIKSSRTYELEKQRINREGLSEEHKLNISKGLTGRTLSDSHRKSISVKRSTTFGVLHTETSKANIGKGRARPFAIVSPDGVLIEDVNYAQFCVKHGLSVSMFCAVLKGYIEHYKEWRLPKRLAKVG